MSSMFWFITFLILLVIELITVNLVTVWFVVGALFAFVVSLFINNVILEVFAFILISVVMLVITRPFFKKLRKKERVALNSERIIGQCGLVLRAIDKHHPGEVKVMGSIWTAISDEKIAVDEEVIILEIDGVKVNLEKVNQKED